MHPKANTPLAIPKTGAHAYGIPKNGACAYGVPKTGRRPLGIPKNFNVVSLRKWKSANGGEPPELPPITFKTPEGARPNDEFATSRITQRIHKELRAGDILVIYETDDVKAGDLAAIESTEGHLFYVGILEMDECYYYLIPTPEYEEEKLHRATHRVVGRAIEILRNGRVVKTSLNLRPVHPVAKIYQFRKRA